MPLHNMLFDYGTNLQRMALSRKMRTELLRGLELISKEKMLDNNTVEWSKHEATDDGSISQKGRRLFVRLRNHVRAIRDEIACNTRNKYNALYLRSIAYLTYFQAIH